VLLHYETPGHDLVRPHMLLVRLDDQLAACHAASSGSSSVDHKIEGPIFRPKKTRDVKPVYPASMQRQRLQGVVVVDMVVSEAGCVTDAHVVRSVAPALDLAALQAASRWTYAPLRHGDHAHPVHMMVTINFTLD